MQTCIIEIAYGAVAVGPSNRKRPDGLNCTVLEKVFRPVYYRLKCRLSGNLAGENIVVSMTKLSLCYTYTGLTIFPVSCLKSVSQRDTAVSSQKRPKSVLDTDDPYHVACLNRASVIDPNPGYCRTLCNIVIFIVVFLNYLICFLLLSTVWKCWLG